jgi:hypothetical protein
MLTVREHSSCLEASRASALAAHSAASLAAAAGLREAARLLRSCEALARAATAALQSSSPGTSGAGEKTTVTAAPTASVSGQRKKKKGKKKSGADSMHNAMDTGLAVDVVPTAALPAAAAFQLSPDARAFAPAGTLSKPGRVLEKKASRERSPRGRASPAPTSSPSTSTSSAAALVACAAVASTTASASRASEDGFSVGQAAVLVGLVSRPELTGSSVTLRSFDSASSRWAVTLDTTGESIRVKAPNLKFSIFKPGGFAADAT